MRESLNLSIATAYGDSDAVRCAIAPLSDDGGKMGDSVVHA